MTDRGKIQRLMRGPSLSFLSRSSLWLEEDHLLSVEQHGTQERYRRFYFEDIQALVVCRTERRFHIGLVLGTFALLGLLLLALASSDGAKVFGGLLLGIFGLLLVINFVKGPGCICEVRTAVSLTRLPAVRRLNKIERALPVLRARIVERQGTTDPTELAGAFEARQQVAAMAGSARGPGADPSVPPRAGGTAYSGKIHLALFSLLLADGVLVMLAFAATSPVLVGFRSLAVLAALFFAIVGITRHNRGKVTQSLRVSTIAALVYLAIGAATIYGALVALQAQRPDIGFTTMDALREIAKWSPHDGIWWLLFFTANAAISGLLGAIGLLHTMSYRAQKADQAAPPIPMRS